MSLNAIVKPVHSADGTKIYADAVGNPANPALVFTHGFSSSAAIFDDIFSKAENSKEFYLVRFDMRAHGRSGKPSDAEGHVSQRYAEDFAAIVKAFDVKNPIFIGWSIGGRILTDIATHLPPGTLRGMISLASAPYTDAKIHTLSTVTGTSLFAGLLNTDDALLAHQTVLAFNRATFLRSRDPGAEFIEETAKAVADGADFCDENPSVSWITRCASIGFAAQMSPTDRVLSISRKQDNTKVLELARSGFPLLVIYGTHDPVFSGEKMIEIIRPNFVDLEVKEFQGAGHSLFLEEPDEIMDAIFKFGKRVAK